MKFNSVRVRETWGKICFTHGRIELLYCGHHSLCSCLLQSRIIKSMLCTKPEDRPEASQIQKHLEDFTVALSPKKTVCESQTL